MDSKAFIPGPLEPTDEFRQRQDYCESLKETIPSEEGPQLNEALEITNSLYQLKPDWVPILFSNHKLLPWHGGCAWIFQMTEDSPLGAYIQMRQQFKENPSYLGLYDRKELIAHELCHIGRMAFNEPKFEEFFAYHTSTGLRRLFGPIVQSSFESMIFVLTLILLLFAQSFALFIDPSSWPVVWFLSWLPIALIGFALVRLYNRHRLLNRCLKTLQPIYGENALAVAFRLTDQEIIDCKAVEQFKAYEQQQTGPRWDQIRGLTEDLML